MMKGVIVVLLICIYMINGDLYPNTQLRCNIDGGAEYYVDIFETVLNTTNVQSLKLNYVTDNNFVIFLIGSDGHLYRSKDEGKTWSLESVESRMPHITDDDSGVRRIYSAEDVTNVVTIYILGDRNGKLWTSNNGGDTYKYKELPLGIYSLSIHPRFPTKVLAYRYQQRELYYSKQFGETGTWSLIHNDILGYFTWTHLHSSDHPDGIYAHVGDTAYTSKLVYSENFFLNSEVIQEHVLWFRAREDDTFIIAVCAEESCDEKELLISNNDGGLKLHAAVFPDGLGETVEENNYYPVEISEDSLWIYVSQTYNTGSEFEYGEIFRSNSFNSRFYRTLSNVKFPDIVKFQSIDGVYLANQYESDLETGEVYGDSNIRTLISFSQGASWDYLPAPVFDAEGQATNCYLDDGCSLHLHGYFETDASWFYSAPNAIGIMIATGNIGRYLNNRDDQVNTYFTRDGGVTWKEVRKGPFIPEIGDHGSVVVMAQTNANVDEFTYSLDDGETWHNCRFSDKKYRVENIRVSQGWDSKKFVLYGEHEGKVVIAQLDFENAFSQGQCTELNGNFEDWSPTDLHSECLMGRETIFRRRKAGVDCWFGEDHQHVMVYRNCSCDAHDYECAFCFDRKEIDGPCIFYCTEDELEIKKLSLDTAGQCDKDTQLREIDNGYVLIEGDSCDSELATSILKPKGFIPCSLHVPTVIDVLKKSPVATIITIVVFLLLISVSVTFCVLKNNPKAQSCLRGCGIGSGPQSFSSVITLTQNMDYSSE